MYLFRKVCSLQLPVRSFGGQSGLLLCRCSVNNSRAGILLDVVYGKEGLVFLMWHSRVLLLLSGYHVRWVGVSLSSSDLDWQLFYSYGGLTGHIYVDVFIWIFS